MSVSKRLLIFLHHMMPIKKVVISLDLTPSCDHAVAKEVHSMCAHIPLLFIPLLTS